MFPFDDVIMIPYICVYLLSVYVAEYNSRRIAFFINHMSSRRNGSHDNHFEDIASAQTPRETIPARENISNVCQSWCVRVLIIVVWDLGYSTLGQYHVIRYHGSWSLRPPSRSNHFIGRKR